MFENAWYVGTYFKIPIRIHWTFLLIFLLYGTMVLSRGGTLHDIFVEFAFVLAIFVCVVLHEYGHALTARRYGIETEDIIMMPLGGVARLRKMPEKPIHELIISIMGPVVNMVISGLLFLGMYLTIGSEGIANGLIELKETSFISWRNFLPTLMLSNIFLMIFNMAPAFPMDGGRVLRALLAMKWGRLKGTRWASKVSQVICIFFIVYGLFNGHFILAMIGALIFFFGNQEYKQVVYDEFLRNKSLDLCVRKPQLQLLEYTNVKEAFNLIFKYAEKNFLVLNLDGRICGTVSARQISKAYKTDPNLKIHQISQSGYISMPPYSSLLQAFSTIQSGHQLIVVEENGEMMGVVDYESIIQCMELGL